VCESILDLLKLGPLPSRSAMMEAPWAVSSRTRARTHTWYPCQRLYMFQAIYVEKHTHVCLPACKLCACIRVCMHPYMCKHQFSKQNDFSFLIMRVGLGGNATPGRYPCTRKYTYTHSHTHTCMHTCIHVYIHAYEPS
jgi:hypothetical protein